MPFHLKFFVILLLFLNGVFGLDTLKVRDSLPILPPAHESAENNYSPPLAALISVFPGLGHFYLGEVSQGLKYLTAIPGLIIGSNYFTEQKPSQYEMSALLALTAQDMWAYNFYSAYRNARHLNKNANYQIPHKQTEFRHLFKAPFQKRFSLHGLTVLPMLLATVLGGSTILTSALEDSTLFDLEESYVFDKSRNRFTGFVLGETQSLLISLNAGIAEEALFRGVLQSEFTNLFGKLPGLLMASSLFGLAHYDETLGDANRAGIVFRGLIGLYLGWIYQRNQYDLRQSVAIHFWWNFFIFSSSFIASPQKPPLKLTISLPLF